MFVFFLFLPFYITYVVVFVFAFFLIHISIVSNRVKTLCFTSDYENIHPKTNPNTLFYSITYINVNFVKKNVMS